MKTQKTPRRPKTERQKKLQASKDNTDNDKPQGENP